MLKILQRYYAYIFLVGIVVVVFAFAYENRPCNNPIQYKVGNIDSDFGISTVDFMKDIANASDIWNNAQGKSLFEYNKDASLTINLIYDYRQETTELRGEIDKSNNVAQSVKDQFDRLEDQYTTEKEAYEKAVAAFNSRAKKYTREQFDAEKKVIEEQRLSLNRLSDEIHTYVNKYNLLVRSINSNVTIVNKNAGEIEEGLYRSDTNTIDIYEYESKVKLFRVLAHELGHALGLDHNDNPESIMYKLNQGQRLSLTGDDLSALKNICSRKFGFLRNIF